MSALGWLLIVAAGLGLAALLAFAYAVDAIQADIERGRWGGE